MLKDDCLLGTGESLLLLSTSSGVGSSSSGAGLLVRYRACITGLMSSSKANGQKTEVETSRESPNLVYDKVQCGGREIERTKGEDYVGLRPRLVVEM